MAGRNLPRRGSRLFPLLSQERDSAAAAHLTSGADRLPGGCPYFHHIDGRAQRLSGAVLFPLSPEAGGSNPWGSTRVAALAHLGELLCSIHYVCPGIGKIALTDELTAFNNQTAAFRGLRRVMVFAGESYASVLSELEAVYPHGDTKLIPYGEAYRRLRLPVHLLSCDDTGAIQLQILATPGYRPRLTQAALKSQYVPPPEGAPALDAMFQGLPFVMAADMDLRRIDAALTTAQRMGRRKSPGCLEGAG